MLLLLDLSNASLHVGVFEKRKPVYQFKTYADRLKSADEYEELIAQSLLFHHFPLENFQGAILTSVVPSLTSRIQQAVSHLLNKECLVLNRSLKTGLAIRLDSPGELGADLICDALGAINDYMEDCLIVDVGGATKFIVATSKKEYLGGIIAPGLRVSSNGLWKNSAQLTDVELIPPKHYIEKNSADSMKAGIIFGHAEMIKGLAVQIEKEYGKPLKKILTGADAELVKNQLEGFIYNPDLLFEGLFDTYVKNTSAK